MSAFRAGDPRFGPPFGPNREPPASPGAPAQVLPLRRVRCECAVCGVHTIATGCVSIGGCCRNCGSYDLRPLAARGSER